MPEQEKREKRRREKRKLGGRREKESEEEKSKSVVTDVQICRNTRYKIQDIVHNSVTAKVNSNAIAVLYLYCLRPTIARTHVQTSLPLPPPPPFSLLVFPLFSFSCSPIPSMAPVLFFSSLSLGGDHLTTLVRSWLPCLPLGLVCAVSFVSWSMSLACCLSPAGGVCREGLLAVVLLASLHPICRLPWCHGLLVRGPVRFAYTVMLVSVLHRNLLDC